MVSEGPSLCVVMHVCVVEHPAPSNGGKDPKTSLSTSMVQATASQPLIQMPSRPLHINTALPTTSSVNPSMLHQPMMVTTMAQTQQARAIHPRPVITNEKHRSPFSNGAKNRDLRCVLLPAPSGAGSKARLESRLI